MTPPPPQTIEIPMKYKKYISSIIVIGGRIWVSTVGCGLFVYNASTFLYECSWGDKEKEQIYKLLSIEETNSIIALTSKGIFSFEAEVDNARLFDSLEYQNCQSENFDVNVGVVVPYMDFTKKCEVWVCSHSERKFYILDPHSLKVLKEVVYIEKDLVLHQPSPTLTAKRNMHMSLVGFMFTKIKEMEVAYVSNRVKVAVADNWMLLLWDAENRKLESVFDCREYCVSHQEDHSGDSLHCKYVLVSQQSAAWPDCFITFQSFL